MWLVAYFMSNARKLRASSAACLATSNLFWGSSRLCVSSIWLYSDCCRTCNSMGDVSVSVVHGQSDLTSICRAAPKFTHARYGTYLWWNDGLSNIIAAKIFRVACALRCGLAHVDKRKIFVTLLDLPNNEIYIQGHSGLFSDNTNAVTRESVCQEVHRQCDG